MSEAPDELATTQKQLKACEDFIVETLNATRERVVLTEEFDSQHYVRLIVCGAIDGTLLDCLGDYVNRQRKRLEQTAEWPQGTGDGKGKTG
jgi:hypothetical protein